MASVVDLQAKGRNGLMRFKCAIGSNNAVLTVPIRIHAVTLSAGTTFTTVAIYDAATVTGTLDISASAAASGTGQTVYFGQMGAVFTVGVSVNLVGTASACTIFYTPE